MSIEYVMKTGSYNTSRQHFYWTCLISERAQAGRGASREWALLGTEQMKTSREKKTLPRKRSWHLFIHQLTMEVYSLSAQTITMSKRVYAGT
jgi:hypothetical protein